MTGSHIRDRGEILRVSKTVAESKLQKFEREASVNDRNLELAQSRKELHEEMVRVAREQAEARRRAAESEEELRASRDKLR